MSCWEISLSYSIWGLMIGKCNNIFTSVRLPSSAGSRFQWSWTSLLLVVTKCDFKVLRWASAGFPECSLPISDRGGKVFCCFPLIFLPCLNDLLLIWKPTALYKGLWFPICLAMLGIKLKQLECWVSAHQSGISPHAYQWKSTFQSRHCFKLNTQETKLHLEIIIFNLFYSVLQLNCILSQQNGLSGGKHTI